MRKMTQFLRDSAQEMKKLSSLTGASMLAALNVVIHQFTTVFINPFLHVTFSFLPMGVTGMLYGPLMAGVTGAITDVLKYMIKQDGSFFFGFTLNEFLSGVLYGLFLYKKPVTLLRVFLACLCNILLIDMVLTPLWLSMLYGKAFFVLFTARLVKSLIMLPTQTILLYFLAKTVRRIHPSLRKGKVRL